MAVVVVLKVMMTIMAHLKTIAVNSVKRLRGKSCCFSERKMQTRARWMSQILRVDTPL
jgi:hypothetical protein